jgi:hypothetical protein
MKHLAPISRRPFQAQQGSISILERVILTLLQIYFHDWQNFQIVYQNLQKYYQKTP